MVFTLLCHSTSRRSSLWCLVTSGNLFFRRQTCLILSSVLPLLLQSSSDGAPPTSANKVLNPIAPLSRQTLQDKKLKGQLAVREKFYGQSAKAAAKAEKWLMPSEEGYLETEGLEKPYRIKQESIIQEVDIISSRKPFDMVLEELGPYTVEYTSNGHYMLLGGRKGHLAMIDMIHMNLIKEFQ